MLGTRIRFAVFVLVACGTLALGGPGETQGGPNPVLLRFVGTYRNPLADAGNREIRDAIERVVSQMPPVRGNIARRRLISGDPPIPRIAFALNGEGLVVDYAGSRHNVTTRLGEFADNAAAGGGRVDVKHDVVGARLRETYRERRGGAVHVFELSPDGNTLSLEATISSPHLPEHIVYRLTFERVR